MVRPRDLPFHADRRGVVEVAGGVDEAHGGGAPVGAGRNPLEGPLVVLDEARPEQQVLGRIAAEDQLGEDGDVALGVLRLLQDGEDALDVAVEVADHGVHLAEGDAHQPHRWSVGRATLER